MTRKPEGGMGENLGGWPQQDRSPPQTHASTKFALSGVTAKPPNLPRRPAAAKPVGVLPASAGAGGCLTMCGILRPVRAGNECLLHSGFRNFQCPEKERNP